MPWRVWRPSLKAGIKFGTALAAHWGDGAAFGEYNIGMCMVQVELFGIPRQRAGLARVEARGTCLSDVLVDLAARYPPLAECCIEDGRLRPGYVASLGNRRFVSDPRTELVPGEVLLILSADAGG